MEMRIERECTQPTGVDIKCSDVTFCAQKLNGNVWCRSDVWNVTTIKPALYSHTQNAAAVSIGERAGERERKRERM